MEHDKNVRIREIRHETFVDDPNARHIPHMTELFPVPFGPITTLRPCPGAQTESSYVLYIYRIKIILDTYA